MIALELRCNKLRLRHEVRSSGTLFVVPKGSTKRQREVWDGGDLSKRSLAPPKPRGQGNPSCFLDVVAPRGSHIYYSKWDAATFFDMLKAPHHLTAHFGRPPVSMGERADAMGSLIEDLAQYLDDFGTEELSRSHSVFPVEATWPMGFSWSSAEAQDVSIDTCVEAGLPMECLLSVDEAPPALQQELACVVTEEKLLFHFDREVGSYRLQCLDRSFDEHHVPRNKSKDIDLASSMVGLGCDLGNAPPRAEPEASKSFGWLAACVDLLHICRAALKIRQWFVLLSRPCYSIYDAAYEFQRREP